MEPHQPPGWCSRTQAAAEPNVKLLGTSPVNSLTAVVRQHTCGTTAGCQHAPCWKPSEVWLVHTFPQYLGRSFTFVSLTGSQRRLCLCNSRSSANQFWFRMSDGFAALEVLTQRKSQEILGELGYCFECSYSPQWSG